MTRRRILALIVLCALWGLAVWGVRVALDLPETFSNVASPVGGFVIGVWLAIQWGGR